MTSPAVNSPNKIQFIEEISLIVAAQDLTPTMMSQDFLKFSGIIPQDWELAQQPVLTPNYAQLNFTNGIGIIAQPRTITISESLRGKKIDDVAIHQVASKYVEKLPHADYIGLSFSPKMLLPFPNDSQAVRQYIAGTLLGSGAWKHIGKAPVQAGINLTYQLERCQMTISISEAKLQQPQQPQQAPIIAILFAGNFNYNINLTREQSGDRLMQMSGFVNNWQIDLEEFRDIVNQKFLDATSADSSQSVMAASLFPGQTL